MGKKSRAKKHRKDWIKVKPEESFSYGPIKAERYGRHVMFKNESTKEQHLEFLKKSEEINKQILADLETKISVLQNTINEYDPVEVMHHGAYMLMPLFMKYKSENEFASDESYYLPTVEYLQYLIARTNLKNETKELTETDWNKLWDMAFEVIQLTSSYLFTRKTISNPPSPIDELRFNLDGRRLAIRGRRYPFYFSDHLRTSLEPYNQQIIDHYGINVSDLITELEKINEYQKTGVLGRYKEVYDYTDIVTEKLREKGYAVDPGATKEEIERTRKALESEEFKNLNDEMQEKLRLTFTSAIFEITDLTNIPKPLLSLLSVRPGENVLTKLTGEDHDDLSPLSNSILHKKPFLEVDGKFYTFYHSGFDDHIADIIESDLFQKSASQIPDMAKRRSDTIETAANQLLSSIINPDFVIQNAYYPDPDNGGNLTELDVLMGVDDILFLVEIKAGGMSEAASRGAPKSLEQEFSDLIIEGQRQSERAEKYIKSAQSVSFYDETGKNALKNICHKDYRKIFRVVVTKEELGWVGAKIAALSIIDPNLSKSYPWHISIDDLRVVAELFKNDPIRFAHYLEVRLLASSQTSLNQSDEIEHVALYNDMNYYHELPFRDASRMTYDPSYMRSIDYYFRDRLMGEQPPVPTQDIPTEVKIFLDALDKSKLPYRFDVGSIVLSMDDIGRKQTCDALSNVCEGLKLGKQRTVRMPFTQLKFGLSISMVDNDHWDEELKRSAVQMSQGECEKWLVVQLTRNLPYKIKNIKVLKSDSFTDDDLVTERLRHEQKVQQVIKENKIGRNDLCPCGSGKKFKRCHDLTS